jgi:hypothetical protein
VLRLQALHPELQMGFVRNAVWHSEFEVHVTQAPVFLHMDKIGYALIHSVLVTQAMQEPVVTPENTQRGWVE